MRGVRRGPQERVGWRGGARQETALLQQPQDVAGGQRLIGGGGALVRVLGGVLLLLGPAVLEPHLDLWEGRGEPGHTHTQETRTIIFCAVNQMRETPAFMFIKTQISAMFPQRPLLPLNIKLVQR